MDLAKHCELCSLQEIDYLKGTSCALTKAKPAFESVCPDIQLEHKLSEKIKEVNIEYEGVQRTRNVTFIYFSVFSLIGIVVIIGGYLLGKYVFDNGVIATVPVVVTGIGLGVMGMAFDPMNTYRRDRAIARDKKQKLDKLLKLYHRTYNIRVIFGKEIHGDIEVDTVLEIKKTFVSPYEQRH